jgi:hypothetical protein
MECYRSDGDEYGLAQVCCRADAVGNSARVPAPTVTSNGYLVMTFLSPKNELPDLKPSISPFTIERIRDAVGPGR